MLRSFRRRSGDNNINLRLRLDFWLRVLDWGRRRGDDVGLRDLGCK